MKDSCSSSQGYFSITDNLSDNEAEKLLELYIKMKITLSFDNNHDEEFLFEVNFKHQLHNLAHN
jgi:hypothetical protein